MINLMTTAEGTRLRLKNGAIGEIVENLGDGIWVQLRMVAPSTAGDVAVGDEELVHCEEVVGLADD